MYILIEHDGTPTNVNLGTKLKNIIEDEYGGVCEIMIGNSPNITLYNMDMREILRFDGIHSDEDLEYIIKFIIDDEEE